MASKQVRLMSTLSKLGPTLKRTEGRATVWGSEFTTKAATPHGDSKEVLPSLCVVGRNQVAARGRVYRETSPFCSLYSTSSFLG
jgi:hypothetical protein